MKVGILTLPLHTNYGGNLQAYALLMVLKDLGHDAIFINRQTNKISFLRFSLMIGKLFVLKLLRSKSERSFLARLRHDQNLKIIGINTKRFIEKHIQPQTVEFRSSRALGRGINRCGFDAIVVGSDQVWRPQYAPNIEDYFLGFLGRNRNSTRRISYAASFGTDAWNFSASQKEVCSSLLGLFDAISVREDSGIALCRTQFNSHAEHVVDPTMLLPPSRYLDLLEGDSKSLDQDDIELLLYILDEDAGTQKVVDSIALSTGFNPLRINSPTEDLTLPLSERIAPPVDRWLRAFRDTRFVVTDSFHACVFAILFNKPFVAYGNSNRGLTRFESLLRTFGLEDRLITNPDALGDLATTPIPWDSVNDILTLQRQKGLKFLEMALSEEYL